MSMYVRLYILSRLKWDLWVNKYHCVGHFGTNRIWKCIFQECEKSTTNESTTTKSTKKNKPVRIYCWAEQQQQYQQWSISLERNDHLFDSMVVCVCVHGFCFALFCFCVYQWSHNVGSVVICLESGLLFNYTNPISLSFSLSLSLFQSIQATYTHTHTHTH